MREALNNLLYCGRSLSLDDPERRPLFLLNAAIMIFGLLTLWIALFNWIYTKNQDLALCNGAVFLISCAAFFLLRRNGNVKFGSRILLTGLAVVPLLVGKLTNSKDYSLVWTLFFPLLAFYFKGLRFGTLLSLAYLSLLVIIDLYCYDCGLSVTAVLNIFFCHIVIILTAFVFESAREDTELRLSRELAGSREQSRILREISIIDDLTQLYNRNYFNEVFEKELLRAKRADRLIAFFILDVDFFKQYNDTYGHFKGDLALQSVGALLNWKLKRADDTAFRLGGEEFGGVIHGNTEDDIQEFAGEICDAIEKLQIPHSESLASSYLTVSIGLTVITPDRAENPDEVYRIADQALYKAKNTGRNRVVSLP